MLFNSYIFLAGFLPVVLIGFFALGRVSHPLAAFWLFLASIFFYGWWNPVYVVLLLASISANYMLGKAISNALNKHRLHLAKQLLWSGLIANLSLLGGYKYLFFLVENLNLISGQSYQLSPIILPLGISFFTFTQIAFLVDAYRGEVKENNLIHYGLFVSYFPHLIAGPVLHHKQMMPQFAKPSIYSADSHWFASGMAIFTIGLAKKVLLADELSGYATPIFEYSNSGLLPNTVAAWLGALAYTLQIYFDFSGYSDMAIGLSRLFGVELPINFNSPYKATNIIDFWRRWHITLSHFLRDYLYISLGGNRKGKWRRHINLALTMLLGGLWHGANWTFVVWGGIHGLYLIINHVWRNGCPPLSFIPAPIRNMAGMMITFLATVIAWVFFRSETLDVAVQIIESMFGFSPLNASDFHSIASSKDVKGAIAAIASGLMFVWLLPNSRQLCPSPRDQKNILTTNSKANWLKAASLGLLFGLTVSKFGQISPFLYFQF